MNVEEEKKKKKSIFYQSDLIDHEQHGETPIIFENIREQQKRFVICLIQSNQASILLDD